MVSVAKIHRPIWNRDVPNSGFRLFDRIRIVLWTIRPNKNTNTNSVAGWAFWHSTCCSDIYHLLMSLTNYGRACMLPSHDPLPFIRLIVSHNQAVWVRAAGTDWVKSAVDVSSSALYRLTIRIRSDDTIRPNTNTLFGPLFGIEANTKRIFGTSLIWNIVFNCCYGAGCFGAALARIFKPDLRPERHPEYQRLYISTANSDDYRKHVLRC